MSLLDRKPLASVLSLVASALTAYGMISPAADLGITLWRGVASLEILPAALQDKLSNLVESAYDDAEAHLGATTIYYASPDGSGTTCSKARPCSLLTALCGTGSGPCGPGKRTPPNYQNGDILIVKDGLYNNGLPGYRIQIQGTDPNNPIIVRAEHGWGTWGAKIDSNYTKVQGVSPNGALDCQICANVWVQGVEITSTNTTSTRQSDADPAPASANFNDNFAVTGVNCKPPLVCPTGLRITSAFSHDAGANGFESNSNNYGVELSNSISINNGYVWTGHRGAGHSIYYASGAPLPCTPPNFKTIRKVVAGHSGQIGLHVYTEGGMLNCLKVEKSFFFDDGFSPFGEAGWKNSGQQALFGANGCADPSGASSKSAKGLLVDGNVWAAGPYKVVATAVNWGYAKGLNAPIFMNNTIALWGASATGLYEASTPGPGCTTVIFPPGNPNETVTGNNFYTVHKTNPVGLQAAHPNNNYANMPTTGQTLIYAPNDYESGAGWIGVLNYSLAASVTVDLLQGGAFVGQHYKILTMLDPTLVGPGGVNQPPGKPVLRGTCLASPCNVTLPTSGFSVAPWVGKSQVAPPDTGPNFIVFLVAVETASAPTPTPTRTMVGSGAPAGAAAPTLVPSSASTSR